MTKFNSDWINETFQMEGSRPEIVTLIGSSRFKEFHEQVSAGLTLQGKIVIPMGLYGHLTGLDMDGPTKKMLDELHFRKIELSDSVYLVNPSVRCCPSCKKPTTYLADNFHLCKECGKNFEDSQVVFIRYIGDSTRRELCYAISKNKTIYSLDQLDPLE